MLMDYYLPGKDWDDDHFLYYEYLSNNESKTSFDCDKSQKTYKVGELLVKSYADENHTGTHSVETRFEYFDKMGRMVMSEVDLGDGNERLTTHYVYNGKGELKIVVPPLAQSASDFELCYYYDYDFKGRMIGKKIPGADYVYMVYDNRDRLVLTQDGNLRASNPNKYKFIKYDCFDRPVLTGNIEVSEDLDQIRTDFNDFNGDYFEYYDGSSDLYGYAGSGNNSYPSGYNVDKASILTITWYDDYEFINDCLNDDINYSYSNCAVPVNFNTNYSDLTMGRVTGSMVKTIQVDNSGYTNLNSEICTVNYFDDEGNNIRSIKHNHMDDYEVFSTRYEPITFQILETELIHKPGQEEVKVHKNFIYDHVGRLLETQCQINDEEKVVLSANRYNELGQLKEKFLHTKDVEGADRAFAQKVDYSYNIRGWLTGINSTDLSEDGNDLFGMELYYSNIDNLDASLVTGGCQYNGNIAAVKWNTIFDKTRGYGFNYDNANRLLEGNYGEGSSLNNNKLQFSESVSDYDENGNIKQLSRMYKGSQADDLVYTYYNGTNQLKQVSDQVSGDISGVADYVVRNQSFYDYDKNGNMKTDPGKGTSIIYNELNLPEKVSGFPDGSIIYFHYDALGNKLAQTIENTNSSTNKSTNYTSNIVFVDDKPSFLYTDEGRAVPYTSEGKTKWHYEYFLKDHLGNTRVVFGGSVIPGGADVMQVNNYYPFGMAFESQNFTSASIDDYTQNKYLYNGKELQDDDLGGVSLGWYDFGARMYDPALGRTTTMDPMAEKFYGMSSYSMMANNPVRYVDPTGMEFTESAWGWVNNLITNINQQQERNNNKISEKQAQLDAGGLKAGKAKRLNKQIGRLNSANESLEGVRGEIATLAASDQVYNVNEISSSSATTTDAVGNSTVTASTSFNTSTNAVDINISSNAGMGLFAHELKHAYQFDQGQMSLGSFGIKSPSYFLYDKQDEYEGYARQGMFGTTETTLPSRYDNLPTGPIDINNYSYKGMKLNQMNVHELQSLSKRIMKQAFRYKVNGIWKTFHH